MHYFSREFLVEAAQRLAADGRYHVARKSIPSKDGPVKVRDATPLQVFPWVSGFAA